MTMENKKIAIIGCGASGLVSAKEVLENGMIPKIFEKEEDLGGVWHPQTGAVWNNMRTNVSRYCMAFGDTPLEEGSEMFPHNSKVYGYLKHYADKWGLRDKIEFSSKVVSIAQDEGQKLWIVEWMDGNKKRRKMEFHGVIIATGIFADPSYPKIKGLDKFAGKLVHSRDYKKSSDFQDLRVLTIGGSVSGPEIASDASSSCKESIHCFRRPLWILRRFLPVQDTNGNRKELPVDLVMRTRQFDKAKEGLTPPELSRMFNERLRTFCEKQQGIESLRIPEENFSGDVNTTISDNYVDQVASGKILVRREEIQEICGDKVIYANGEIDEVDAIILGTGYQVDNSFFSQDILDKLSYDSNDITIPIVICNGTVHPHIPNLFFVGLAKPPFLNTMEQQARWAARVLSGRIELPPMEEMELGLQKVKEVRIKGLRPQFPYGYVTDLTDRIAKCGQSFPDLKNLSDVRDVEVSKEEILKHFTMHPVIAAQYNFLHKPQEALKFMRDVEKAVKLIN